MISFRERDVWTAIKAILDATKIFDNVYIGVGEANHSAEDILSAEIDAYDGQATDEYDDTSGPLLVESRVQLLLIASDAEPTVRDSKADLILAITANALNGQSLGGLTLPGFTKLSNWRYGPIEPPHRKITAILKFAYLTDSWAGFNTSE
jgi:hypothetical protein